MRPLLPALACHQAAAAARWLTGAACRSKEIAELFQHPPAHVVSSYRRTILDCILGTSAPPEQVRTGSRVQCQRHHAPISSMRAEP